MTTEKPKTAKKASAKTKAAKKAPKKTPKPDTVLEGDIVDDNYEFKDIGIFSATNAALASFKEKYSVVPDCSTKEGYEQAKEAIGILVKSRTAVDGARLEKTEVYRDMVKAINTEGSRIMDALKELETPLKDAKQLIDDEEKRKREERIAKLQEKVDEIKVFIELAKGKSSAEIQDIMESVELIPTDSEFFDLKKEAIDMQRYVIGELTQMMLNRVEFENQEKARKLAEEQAAEMKRKQAIINAAQEITDSINSIRMIPVDFIGESSDKMTAKLEELAAIDINESIYNDRVDEAAASLEATTSKLTAMRDQQLQIEAIPVDIEPVVDKEPSEENEETAEEDLSSGSGSRIDTLAESAFADEEHDREHLQNAAEHLKNLVFPEMKTARGQDIVNNARRQLGSVSTRLIAAIESI